MVQSKFTALIAGLGVVALLTGCEGAQSDNDLVLEAQTCLDSATSSTVDSCLTGISSLKSENAYGIRCAAGFLKSGVSTVENMSNALNAIKDNGSTATMLSVLNFEGSTSLANWTAEQCSQSGSSGLALLGAMAKSATALAASTANFASCSGGITNCTDSELENLMTDLTAVLTDPSPDPTDYDNAIGTVTAVVESIQAVYSVSCGTSNANTDICGPINTALADANITPAQLLSLTDQQIKDLGIELLAQWQ